MLVGVISESSGLFSLVVTHGGLLFIQILPPIPGEQSGCHKGRTARAQDARPFPPSAIPRG